MKRQNYGPRLGKLVFQLPRDLTSAYYLCLGLQNGSGRLGHEKLLKIVSCEKSERDNGGSPSGIGGWPPISTWIIPPPLGSNGPHYVEFLHEMRKLLLNLVPGEPLALVQELASFDNPIQLDLLSVSVLDLHVHDTICGDLFHVVWV